MVVDTTTKTHGDNQAFWYGFYKIPKALSARIHNQFMMPKRNARVVGSLAVASTLFSSFFSLTKIVKNIRQNTVLENGRIVMKDAFAIKAIKKSMLWGPAIVRQLQL
ncbi:hypothetical protein D3C87_1769240 [compost metagenome]